MKRKRFSVEQIVAVLKQAELGMAVACKPAWGIDQVSASNIDQA